MRLFRCLAIKKHQAALNAQKMIDVIAFSKLEMDLKQGLNCKAFIEQLALKILLHGDNFYQSGILSDDAYNFLKKNGIIAKK